MAVKSKLLQRAEKAERMEQLQAQTIQEQSQMILRLREELRQMKEGMAVSVDTDGIITTHAKAEVWPYDAEFTAVQVRKPNGYIEVHVKRHDNR